MVTREWDPLKMPTPYAHWKNNIRARHGGSNLPSQHFGRPRHVVHLRSGVQDQHGQLGKTPKNTKISWVWWCALVIPATWEAEAGESLEPAWGCSEPRLYHCTPAWEQSKTPSQKRRKWNWHGCLLSHLLWPTEQDSVSTTTKKSFSWIKIFQAFFNSRFLSD